LDRLAGHEHVYLGFAKGGRRMTLPDPGTLDAWFAAAGLLPIEATTVALRTLENGTRTTINALYGTA
jgi:hypothetical protein